MGRSWIDVLVEEGRRRVFVSALDLPGWARAGRDEEEALAALIASGPRYATALRRSGVAFEPPDGPTAFRVAERMEGDATTDFGAPSRIAEADRRPVARGDAVRLTAILQAAWAAFDTAAAEASGRPLRTGPRGGGRDLERMLEHVVGADEAYLRKLGARPPREAGGTPRDRWPALRARHLEVIAALARGEPIDDPARTSNPWPIRFDVRRAAWHALDHAWELEDRIVP
jgi:hypothetical protein